LEELLPSEPPDFVELSEAFVDVSFLVSVDLVSVDLVSVDSPALADLDVVRLSVL